MTSNNRICVICAEDYTDKKRKPIQCQKCSFECCFECLKKHVLSDSDPMCMNPDCRVLFPESYLFKIFSHSFMTGAYRKNRNETLYNREKMLLEGTMSFVERAIEAEKLKVTMEKLRREQLKLAQEMNAHKVRLQYLKSNQDTSPEDIKKKSNYLKKCVKDGCQGFLNSAYSCSICDTKVCGKCFQIKDPDNNEHICDPDQLKTAEFLRKDTKSCPNCGEMIHKTEGCNQMYCIMCHTAFDWTSLRIITGVIHNPHYFEYLNRQHGQAPRTPGDLVCGGPPNSYTIRTRVFSCFQNYLQEFDTQTRTEVINICQLWLRLSNHIQYVEIPQYTNPNNFQLNLDTRIKFMRNQISETKFKSLISRRYNTSLRNDELRQVFETLHNLIDDKLRYLVGDQIQSPPEVINILIELENISIYINECFQKLSTLFRVSVPYIDITEAITDKNSPYRNISRMTIRTGKLD